MKSDDTLKYECNVHAKSRKLYPACKMQQNAIFILRKYPFF